MSSQPRVALTTLLLACAICTVCIGLGRMGGWIPPAVEIVWISGLMPSVLVSRASNTMVTTFRAGSVPIWAEKLLYELDAGTSSI
jgi:hypothetical protein